MTETSAIKQESSSKKNTIDKHLNDAVAVIGMAGFFPGSDSIEEFCQKLENQESLFTSVPENHFPEPNIKNRFGAFLKEIGNFDRELFNLSPIEADYMDPRQRLLLMSVWHMLEDSCYSVSDLNKSSVNVYISSDGSPYSSFIQRSSLTPYSGIGTSCWALANRISHAFNFKGKSLVIDTACSGSSVALHEAIQSLRKGEAEYAVVGASQLLFGEELSMAYLGQESLGILGDTASCYPFQDKAAGILPAESVVTVLLKKYEYAKRDQDNIHAILLGSHVNSGGAVGTMTAPSSSAQADAIVNAYLDAKVDPSTVTYIEAHGASSIFADAEEIKAFKISDKKLGKLFKIKESTPCKISSLKPNIGHAASASGLVSLVRVIHSFKKGVKLGIRGFSSSAKNINIDNTRFYISDATEPWSRIKETDGSEVPRRAAINNFGVGGVNAHLLVEEFIGIEDRSLASESEPGTYLLPLSAMSDTQLLESAGMLLEFLKTKPLIVAEQLEYLYLTARKSFRHRLVLRYNTLDDLVQKLTKYTESSGQLGYQLKSDTKHVGDTIDLFLKHQQAAQFLKSLTNDSDKNLLFELWSYGLEEPIAALYQSKSFLKTSLPRYPFSKQHYWVNETNESESGTPAPRLHHLIHKNISNFNGIQYRTDFSGNELYLKKQILDNRKVLLGIVYMEMARIAYMEANGFQNAGDSFTLRMQDLKWAAPLYLDGSFVSLCVGLSPTRSGALFDISSVEGEGGRAPVVYCQGQVNLGAQTETRRYDFESLKEEYHPAAKDIEQWANLVSSAAACSVDTIYLSHNHLLARISITDANISTEQQCLFYLYMLEAVLQVSRAIMVNRQPLESQELSDSLLPISLDSLIYIADCRENMWAVVSLRDSTGLNQGLRCMDVDLCDNEGTVCLRLESFIFQQHSELTQTQLEQDDKKAILGDEKSDSPRRSDDKGLLDLALLREKTQWRLTRLFAEVTKLPHDSIDASEPLESYSIDSILIAQLNHQLVLVFGEISKTLFFEYQTLGALADYFVDVYQTVCIDWIGLKQAASTADYKNVNVKIPSASLTECFPFPVLSPITCCRKDYNRNYDQGSAVLAGSHSHQEPIAIIGISGRYPKANNLKDFWRNLTDGIDCIDEIPGDRWSLDGFYEADPDVAVEQIKSYSKWGGFIEGFAEFDPFFFNISPREALSIDPQERLFLQSCWHTFEDAGYTKERLALQHNGRVGVFAGVTKNGFGLYGPIIWQGGEPVFAHTSFGSVANRVSYVMNLHGPSMPVDTMCSSSLTAIHEACQHLRSGECEMAIAGGVNLYLHPSSYIGLCSTRMLSLDGQCKSFGEGGNGFVPGEGVGTVLLKSLSRAEADGDFIYAVIRGSGVNHGGKTNGYTVPNPTAQGNLIREVLQQAGVDARAVSYVEAHGTGTKLGDPIEITGLTQAFQHDTQDTQYCALGSAKSNIGHLEAAAGIAGLTKIILQMKHQQIVPTLHAKKLNSNINFDKTPFVVQQSLTDWEQPRLEKNGRVELSPRIASLSSFGAGGANAHVIIEEYCSPVNNAVIRLQTENRSELNPALVILSAKTEDQLKLYARDLHQHLQDVSDDDLHDLAYTLQIGREAMDERLAVIVSSIAELQEKLSKFLSGRRDIENFYRDQVKRNKETLSVLTGDVDLQKGIDRWIELGKYNKLLELWVKGLIIDWNKLQGGFKPHCISLPTYPFAKERFWLDTQSLSRQVPEGASSQNSKLHPLLHENTSTLICQRYSSTFTGKEFFLNDHRVNGKMVLPGVAYLEMAQAAMIKALGEDADGNAVLQLKNVVWSEPIIVENNSVSAHIGLFPESNGEIAYEIYSDASDEGNSRSALHSQGRMLFTVESELLPLDLDMLQQTCRRGRVSKAQCYQAFETMGISYGPAHRGVSEIFVGDAQILAKLILPQTLLGSFHQFALHPSLLDSALQASIGLMPLDSLPQLPALPFALKSLSIYKRCPAEIWAWIRVSGNSSDGDRVQYLDIDLCDDQGNICVRMLGFSSRVFTQQKRLSAVDTVMLKPTWFNKSAKNNLPAWSSNDVEDRYIVLISNSKVIYGDIAAQLQGAHIKHIALTRENVSEAFKACARELFEFIQEILRSKPSGKTLLQLALIEHNLEGVFSGLSSLLAMLKTAQLENSKLQCQLIELEDSQTGQQIVAALNECHQAVEDEHIRYLRDGRHVAGWSLLDVEVSKAETVLPWRDNGIYLITGGAGGLGLILAEDILRNVSGAMVILTGRSELDDERAAVLAALNATPSQLIYKRVDVSDVDQVRALIATIKTDVGRLQGIIHSAGVIQDNFIIKKTVEELDSVLASKVSGTVNLDLATQYLELDFFVLFSSVTGSMGNAGQADYATANAFMDNYSHYRNKLVTEKKRYGRTLSINWPLWKHGGMRINEQTEKLMLQNAQLAPLETSEGLDVLYRGIATELDQFLVLCGNKERILQKFNINTEEKKKSYPVADIAVNSDQLQELVQKELVQLVCRIIRAKPDDIDVDEELSVFGFDSIGLTEFANQLNHEFQLELIPTLFFEYPTLREVAKYFIAEHHTVFSKHFKLDVAQDKTVVSDAELDKHASAGGELDASPPVQARQLRRRYFEATHFAAATTPASSHREPVAIVGMSGCFPMAEDLMQFWRNLVEERDCIAEIPTSRWDWRAQLDEGDNGEDTAIKWCSFMDGVAEFDPLFFGISPREAEFMDPQHRLLMTHVWKAIEDAGYSPEHLSGTQTGVFIGTGNTGYSELILQPNIDIEGYSTTGNVPSMGPNRVSYLLNLHGPSEPIETACSSSLVAIHRAVESMQSGNCDKAIVGGVNTIITPHAHTSFSKAGMLSSDGRCKTFSDRANGYVRGEGVGILLLKKLSDAERDGDHIYGLILGSAENHGGRANSLTAPNPKAQAELLQSAYRNAGVDPRSVGYIEAHGTGTELGDPVEINGLKSAFRQLYQDFVKDGDKGGAQTTHCGLGSVKSNIGHLELAAGIAGVIKVLLQLQHQTLVKSLHSEPLNPYIDLKDSPFYVVQEKQSWNPLKDDQGRDLPRRAGISSFGFGGVNAHVVIEEYVNRGVVPGRGIGTLDSTIEFQQPELIVLSAKDEVRLHEVVVRLKHYLVNSRYIDADHLKRIAYTLQVGRQAMEERLALIVNSTGELEDKLSAYLLGNKSIDGLFRGRVKRNKSDLEALAGDEEFQETVTKWCQRGKFSKLLELWVKGLNFNWHSLYKDILPQRLSLPSYPFAKDHYWVGGTAHSVARSIQYPVTAKAHSTYNAGSQTIKETVSTHDERFDTSTAGADVLMRQHSNGAGILEHLTRLIAEATHIPADKIDIDADFEEFGLDSVMIQGLNRKIDDWLGWSETALFYKYKTLESLSEYLLQRGSTVFSSQEETATGTTGSSVPLEVVPRNEDDIAIVGMSGRYPGAADLDAFWENLKEGKDCITEIPIERFDYRIQQSAKADSEEGIYCKWGGFIDEAELFDASFFRITPQEACGIDPQERLFLECAWNCLESSGYIGPDWQRHPREVGVFAGATFNNYQLLMADAGRHQAPFYVANSQTFSIANRVSYFFNFVGPSLTLDTACSSSLYAVHQACESLKRGECEMALAGGVNLSLHPSKYLMLCRSGFAARDGRCHSFASGGDGYVPGEAVGVVLLKPYRQALVDGDRILALIKGGGVSNDGKTQGFTVPNPVSQSKAIKAALAQAKVDPASISYIEAHGTGTELGDPIEVQGLKDVFAVNDHRGTEIRSGYCALGSVKSNIGHGEAAAGIAQLTKVVLQLQHKTKVASLLHGPMNTGLNLEGSPFYVQREKAPWVANERDGHTTPLRAGVSSFGAGGANVHLVLEEAPVVKATPTVADHTKLEDPYWLIPLSAINKSRLVVMAERLLAFFEREKSVRIEDIAYTLQQQRAHFNHRVAWVVSSVAELCAVLSSYCREQNLLESFSSEAEHQGGADNIESINAALQGDGRFDKNNLNNLAQLWVLGARFDWSILTAGRRGYGIELPTYPFDKKRYWIDSPESGMCLSDEGKVGIAEDFTQIDEWLLETSWKSKPAPRELMLLPTSVSERTLLIISDSGELLDKAFNGALDQDFFGDIRILKCWIKKGEKPQCETDFILDVDFDIESLISVLDQEDLHSVVILQPATAPELLIDSRLTQCIDWHLSKLHRILQAMIQVLPGKQVNVAMINDMPNGDSDSLQETLSKYFSFIRVEYPELSCRIIDLDVWNDAGHRDIWRELNQNQGETRIRFINGDRQVQRLHYQVPMQGTMTENEKTFDTRGCMLVTGAFGGVGQVLVKWLVVSGVKELILLGRKPRSAKLGINADDSVTIDSLIEDITRQGASIHYFQVDMTNADAVQECIRGVREELQYPITGVFHLAGITTDAIPLNKMTEEKFRDVLRPKLDGAITLQRLTLQDPIRYFCLFSSISSVEGMQGNGLSAYASANAALDGVAQWRRRQGMPVQLIQWTDWQEVGMALEYDHSAFFNAMGMYMLPSSLAVQLLENILSCGTSQCIVFNVEWQKYSIVNPGIRKLPFFSDYVEEMDKRRSVPVSLQFGSPVSPRQRLENLDEESLNKHIRTKLSQLLGSEYIDTSCSFNELGLDSINSVSFFTELSEELALEVSPSIVFRYPTPTVLVAYLLEQLAEVGSSGEKAQGETGESNENIRSQLRAAIGSAEALLSDSV